MLGRKVLALSLILVLCFGTGVALAVDENPPSEGLLRLTEQSNELTSRLSAQAETFGARIEAAYDAGYISHAVADSLMKLAADSLKSTTDAIYARVIARCEQENVSYDCVYVTVQIGWHSVLVDPIYVPGNSD